MKIRVSGSGHCGVNAIHPTHLHPLGTVDSVGNVLMEECLGQYSHCNNCDDRGCMDCVMRVVHDKCEWSCPFCKSTDAEYISDLNIFEDDEHYPTPQEENEAQLEYCAQLLHFQHITPQELKKRTENILPKI